MKDWMTGIPWIALLIFVLLLFRLSDGAKAKKSGEESEERGTGSDRLFALFAWLIAGMGIGVLACFFLKQELIYGVCAGVIPGLIKLCIDNKK